LESQVPEASRDITSISVPVDEAVDAADQRALLVETLDDSDDMLLLRDQPVDDMLLTRFLKWAVEFAGAITDEPCGLSPPILFLKVPLFASKRVILSIV
jgi:hypothetical protein